MQLLQHPLSEIIELKHYVGNILEADIDYFCKILFNLLSVMLQEESNNLITEILLKKCSNIRVASQFFWWDKIFSI